MQKRKKRKNRAEVAVCSPPAVVAAWEGLAPLARAQPGALVANAVRDTGVPGSTFLPDFRRRRADSGAFYGFGSRRRRCSGSGGSGPQGSVREGPAVATR